MKARPKGRIGNRKQRWCGFGVSSVQDQEKMAIVEVMMRKPMWKTSPARGTTERVEERESKNGKMFGLVMARGRCWTGAWKRALEVTGFRVDQGIKDLTFREL